MADPRTLQQLKSLGYLGGSSEPEYALTGRGIDPKDRVEVLRLLYLAVSPDARESVSRRLPLLRQAIAMDPANPMIYYYLGDEFGRVKRQGEAIKLYEDGLRKGLKNAWLFSRLGHLYLRQGNRDKAISAYERAAQLNPSDSESMNDLGMIYLEMGKLADAERVFKWSVAADETYALAYNGLGLVSIQKQDLAAARVHFEKAAQLDPNLLEAQLNLGRIYKIMGANTRAKGYFEAFLAKAPPAQYGPIIAKVKEELATMQ
jgi:tetratricopeptide (TPR) repeat protein